MADYKVTDTELTSIANAIRTKGGTQAQLEFPTGFVSAVQAIPTGGGVIQPLSATQNGTYNPPSGVDGYAPVTVNVSGGGSTIPGAVLLTPYEKDIAIGYVGSFGFYAYQSSYSDYRSDFYDLGETVGERYFIIFIAQSGNNRFRITFLSEDPSLTPVGTETTYSGKKFYMRVNNGTFSDFSAVNIDTSSGAYIGYVFKFNVTSTNRYLIITKTNQNVDNINSYVVEITGVA